MFKKQINLNLNPIKRPTLKPYGKNGFELTKPYEFYINEKEYKIPQGFKIRKSNSEYLTATLIHSYLIDLAEYAYIGRDTKESIKVIRYADLVFLKILLFLGVNRFKAKLFYYSYRVYHSLKYMSNKHKKVLKD